MASHTGPPTDALEQHLRRRARQYDFFQLMQVLERIPTGVLFGHQDSVSRQRIRFRAEPTLAFSPSDVVDVRWLPPKDGDPGDAKFELTVSFMGLYGPASPLPTHYTEAIIAGDLDNTNRRDFLDYFHQRLLAFVYRIWKKYRYYVQFDSYTPDELSSRIFALMGVFAKTDREAVDLHWNRLVACAGLLVIGTRPAEAINRVIGHYFGGIPVSIEPFVFRLAKTPANQRPTLGSHSCRLAQDAVLGEHVPDRSGRCRLHLGPVSWERFQDFLPTGRDHQPLQDLLDLLIRDPLSIELRLTVSRHEQRMHGMQLGSEDPCTLGWNSWLGEPLDESLTVDFLLRP